MRYLLLILSMLAALPAVAAAGRADDDLVLPTVAFSATDVQQSGPLMIRETIHYARGKLRIDRANGFSDTIIDFNTQSQYLLMANHTYLVLPMDDALFRRFIAHNPAWSNETKVGTERLDGLETTKYAFGDDGPLNAAGMFWLTKTGIMVRRVYDDGVFGENVHHVEYLTNISVSPQPASLFSIPPGYTLAK
jgi:hypothetical protein